MRTNGSGNSAMAQHPPLRTPRTSMKRLAPDVKLTAFNNGCKGNVVTKKVTSKPLSRFSRSARQAVTTSLRIPLPTARLLRATLPRIYGGGPLQTAPDIPLPHNDKDLPDHTFPALGTYTVTLYVSNGECDYEMFKTVVVAEYIPDFTADKPTGCKAHTCCLRLLPTTTGLSKAMSGILAMARHRLLLQAL
jgi:hypothetical protein